jgi:hypothetical protein
LFKYLPGKDWSVEVEHKIDKMRQKNATDTFIARNKTALQGKTSREKNEASFGSAMIIIARATRTYAFKYMVPNHIDENDLPSGLYKQDALYAMRKCALYHADCLEKIKASVSRNGSITGESSCRSMFHKSIQIRA